MRKWNTIHPAAVFVYFLAVILMTMLSQNPAVAALSLMGSITFFSLLPIKRPLRMHLFSLILFLILTLINPLFSKSGETALFYFNQRPITMEALLYGAVAAASLTAALYWFRCFSFLMTSDKLMYLFSRLSKKLSMILTMSLRFIPLFMEQYHKISDTQKALGLYRDGNIVDSIRGKLRVTDILITWTLEGGIITAESMETRGWGTGRRSFYSRYRLLSADIVLLIVSALLTGLSVTAVYTADFRFYPAIAYRTTLWTVIGLIAFLILCLLPLIIHTQEALRWQFLKSKI